MSIKLLDLAIHFLLDDIHRVPEILHVSADLIIVPDGPPLEIVMLADYRSDGFEDDLWNIVPLLLFYFENGVS